MDSLNKQYIDGLKKLVQISKILFTPVAVSFLFIIAWRNIDVLVDVFNKIQLELLITAVIGWSVLYIFYPIMLLILCRSWNQKLSFKSIYYIYINRLPAKYIPGGIWHTVVRFADFSILGLKKRQLTAMLFLENIIPLGITLLLGGLVLQYYVSSQPWHGFMYIFAIFGGVALVLSLFLVNRYILDEVDKLPLVVVFQIIVVQIVYWLLITLIFIFYMQVLSLSTIDQQPVKMGGVYLFSWGVGNLAFFAPQGIGVFEFVSAELLRGDMSVTSMAVLISGFRVIALCADVFSWVLLKFLYLFRGQV